MLEKKIYLFWNDKSRTFYLNGEFRTLKKGDFYLSGAILEVYEFPGKESFQRYYICKEILK